MKFLKIIVKYIIIALVVSKFNLFAENYNIEKSTIDEDRIEAEAKPEISDQIADKWYDLGNKEIALEFDNLLLQKWPQYANEIADKWYAGDEQGIAIAFEFEKNHPSLALRRLDDLIEEGEFEKAEKYANEMLEYWISQSDEKIQENIIDKLRIAVLIESNYYYTILHKKLAKKTKHDFIQNYLKYFENIPLSTNLRGLSIIDYLTHRTYINPEFLNKNNISIEEARKLLEMDLYELAKLSDSTFSILHIIALYAKENPFIKLNIFYKNPVGKRSVVGKFQGILPSLQRTFMSRVPLKSKLFRTILIHEWTHQLMYILFNNLKPFAANDETAKMAWDKVQDMIWKRLDETPEELKKESWMNPLLDPYKQILILFKDIKRNYSPSQYADETIARFSQAIAMNTNEDPKVNDFLQPIYDYWMQFIQPAIDKFVNDRADIDTFISDWERENVLDPFYRIEVERDEYQHDLMITQADRSKAEPLAEKWFMRDNIEYALALDKIYIQSTKNHPEIHPLLKEFLLKEIMLKWEKRNYPDIAKEIEEQIKAPDA